MGSGARRIRPDSPAGISSHANVIIILELRCVIAGLDPAIHEALQHGWTFERRLSWHLIMAARVKPGHDESMRAALAEIGEGLFGEAVELTRLGVAFDLLIETRGIERLEPVAEFCELVGRQLGDGFFEVFDSHVGRLAQTRTALKPCGSSWPGLSRPSTIRDPVPS